MQLHEMVAQRESEVRDAGQRAFEDGKRIVDCPHRSNTREADLWRRGFANAMFGSQMTRQP